jgi:hypothetical protein
VEIVYSCSFFELRVLDRVLIPVYAGAGGKEVEDAKNGEIWYLEQAGP